MIAEYLSRIPILFVELNQFFGIELIRVPAFMGLAIRFLFNLFVVLIISRYLYYRISKRKDYYFTYILISTTVFFICVLLEHVELELGFALGLFAVFGIIRYRTDPIPIKEMTFLFVIIGISVINALASDIISYAELGFTNFSIILVIWAMERVWAVKQVLQKRIIYENIELIKPEYSEELKDDLEKRTGLEITKVEIGDINFLRDTVDITIVYKK
jgi:hypothetical protein